MAALLHGSFCGFGGGEGSETTESVTGFIAVDGVECMPPSADFHDVADMAFFVGERADLG